MRYTIWTTDADLSNDYSAVTSGWEFERHAEDGLTVWTTESRNSATMQQLLATDRAVVR